MRSCTRRFLATAWRRSAARGNVQAQLNLGVMYDSGAGVPQDYAQAVEWWRKADFDAYAAEPRTEPAAGAIVALARPVSAPSVVVARVQPGA